MAFERADVFEFEQLGIETTFGSAVSATKKLTSTTILNKIMAEVNTFGAKGSLFDTVGIENKEWTEADWTADVATYTEPGYAISSLLGSPSITTPGGGTLTRDWDWNPSSFSGVTPKSYTLESGNFVRAGKSPGHVVKTVGFDYTRDGVSYHAASIGQLYVDAITPTPGTNEIQTITKSGTVSGGTFTIAVNGEVTTAIAFGANNATVLAALEALPNVGTGGIAVGGGPVNTTPITLTFLKQFAGQNMPLVVVDSSLLTGGGTYVPTETTPGVPLTELALQPVSGNHWDVYADALASGLGGTKLTRALEVSWEISEMYGPLWVGNTSNTSYVNYVPLKPSTSFRMLLEADSAGMAYLTQFRAGTKVFVRVEAIGPTIEGALKYRQRNDLCVILNGITPFGESQGVTTVEWNGVIIHDATWAKAISLNQRSILLTL